MNHECKYEKVMGIIIEDIREIKSDVKSLLKFKWQLMGIVTFISFVVSLLIAIFKE